MARKTKGEIQEAIDELERLVKSREILNYSERDLATRLGMTRKTVRKHLKSIRVQTGSKTIDAITQSFLEDFNMIMTEVQKQFRKALKSKDTKQIIYFTNQLSRAWITFADLLERFGIKPKAVENIAIKAHIDHNVTVDYLQEIQSLE